MDEQTMAIGGRKGVAGALMLVYLVPALCVGCKPGPSQQPTVTRKERSDSRASTQPIQMTGHLPWNGRYGIRVTTDGPDGKVLEAKVIEYGQDGAIKAVPQTATPMEGEGRISILFDEHAGDMIGLANYQISRPLIHREGRVYVGISGREVEVE